MTNSDIARGTLVVTVSVEITEQALAETELKFAESSIQKTSKKVYEDNSNEINGSLSGEAGSTEPAVEGVAGSLTGKAQTNLGVSWKRISEVATSSDTEKSFSLSAEQKFQEGVTQIFAVTTTTFSLLESTGTDIVTQYIGTGSTSKPLVPGSTTYKKFELNAWTTAVGITEVPKSKRIVFTYANIPLKRYTWIPISRGDEIPTTAIYGGDYEGSGDDGPCYVGQFDGEPGKINLSDGKMYNCWVRDHGSSTTAEILTTSFKHRWDDYTEGMKIPTNAVIGADGETWVGKADNDEIGWIDTDDNGVTLYHLCCSDQGELDSGKVLIIDPTM